MNYLSNLQKIPNSVLVGIMLDAQKRGLDAVRARPAWSSSIESFWSVYNSEFRKQAERWIIQNANLEA